MGEKLNLVPSCAVFTLALWGGRVKTQGGARRAEGLVFHSAVSGTSGTVHEVKWGGKSGDALEQTNLNLTTGFSSEIGTKLRDWAVVQAGGSCYSRAALSSNDSKTL